MRKVNVIMLRNEEFESCAKQLYVLATLSSNEIMQACIPVYLRSKRAEKAVAIFCYLTYFEIMLNFHSMMKQRRIFINSSDITDKAGFIVIFRKNTIVQVAIVQRNLIGLESSS